MTEAPPKAKALADGVEVWCEFGKLVPVDELKPNPRNPNTHPRHQVELLAKNIRHFGWRHPITVSMRSGPLPVDMARLREAIDFEFDLPYPDGSRMGLAAEARAAFSKRLGVKL